MAAYLAQAHRLLKQFSTYQIQQVPRSKNNHVDALSLLASIIDDRIGRRVPVKILAQSSMTEAEICAVQQNPIWMDAIHTYLTNGTLPEDKAEAKSVCY